MENRRDFKRAVDAGCDDPLVVYLYTRFMYDPQQATPKTAVKFTMAARQLDNLSYAGLIQCFGHLRAAQAWRSTDTNKPPQVNEHRGLAFDRLLKVLQHDMMRFSISSGIYNRDGTVRNKSVSRSLVTS